MSDETSRECPISPLGQEIGRLYDALPDQVLKLKLLQFLEALAQPGAVAPRLLDED